MNSLLQSVVYTFSPDSVSGSSQPPSSPSRTEAGTYHPTSNDLNNNPNSPTSQQQQKQNISIPPTIHTTSSTTTTNASTYSPTLKKRQQRFYNSYYKTPPHFTITLATKRRISTFIFAMLILIAFYALLNRFDDDHGRRLHQSNDGGGAGAGAGGNVPLPKLKDVPGEEVQGPLVNGRVGVRVGVPGGVGNEKKGSGKKRNHGGGWMSYFLFWNKNSSKEKKVNKDDNDFGNTRRWDASSEKRLAQRKLEEQRKRVIADEKIRIKEEQQRKAHEEKRFREEVERRLKAEEEAEQKRIEEEVRRLREERRLQREEEQRKKREAEIKLMKEEEERLRQDAEEERRFRDEEEQAKRRESEERKRREDEDRRRKEDEERRQREDEERKRKDEEEKKKAAEINNPALDAIDLLQVRFIDWLNGETNAKDPKQVFGGSLNDASIKFHPQEAWIKLVDFANSVVNNKDYNRTNFNELGRRTRSLVIMYKVLHDRKDLHYLLGETTTDVTQTAKRLVDGFTELLFSWTRPWRSSIRDMQTGYEGRGIVITTGTWHFEMAIHAIQTLRLLGCTLPVEIHYIGASDLPADRVEAITLLPNVTTVDTVKLTGSEGPLMGGWAIKPFAMLVSKFREVIFVDADALFIQNPDLVLNNSKVYRDYGQMFFNDRSLGIGTEPKWFRGFVKYPSQYAEGNRYLRKISVHEMESGVVVLDKGRTDVLLGLLTVCKLNSKVERDGNIYHWVHGDKDTFWIGWEISRLPYHFVLGYGGTIGYRGKRGEVCGGLFHIDENMRPLWWNGGVLSNKHAQKDKNFMEFEWWATDLSAKNITWDWETETKPFCLIPTEPAKEVQRLTYEERRLTREFIWMYREIKELGWKKYIRKITGLGVVDEDDAESKKMEEKRREEERREEEEEREAQEAEENNREGGQQEGD
ncbi:hypothetical protein HDU76_001219 [Blyttiomyces sp. JEL0837]|nr:hypothetical protein HDU76_001219 [Blyttiomyces sp. JEL0837]